MKAVVSSTYDSKYLFFIPIITWCWNKLGIDVICFMPEPNNLEKGIKLNLIMNTMRREGFLPKEGFWHFKCLEHKEATYAQCSRLYAAALDLPEDEVLVTSDADMGVFTRGIFDVLASHSLNDGVDISILGPDLVPDKQVPMCYIIGKVSRLREIYGINERTYQQCLDDLLGDVDSVSMRSDYWAKDQEEAWERIYGKYRDENKPYKVGYGLRTNGQNQFATKRLDRDDAFLLERLSQDIIDFHMPRPGFEENAFSQIMTVLKYFYPDCDFQWLIDYRNEYIKLL